MVRFQDQSALSIREFAFPQLPLPPKLEGNLEFCAICLEDTIYQTQPRLDCGHVYHKECLSEIVFESTLQNLCPLCRAPISPISPGTTSSQMVPDGHGGLMPTLARARRLINFSRAFYPYGPEPETRHLVFDIGGNLVAVTSFTRLTINQDSIPPYKTVSRMVRDLKIYTGNSLIFRKEWGSRAVKNSQSESFLPLLRAKAEKTFSKLLKPGDTKRNVRKVKLASLMNGYISTGLTKWVEMVRGPKEFGCIPEKSLEIKWITIVTERCLEDYKTTPGPNPDPESRTAGMPTQDFIRKTVTKMQKVMQERPEGSMTLHRTDNHTPKDKRCLTNLVQDQSTTTGVLNTLKAANKQLLGYITRV